MPQRHFQVHLVPHKLHSFHVKHLLFSADSPTSRISGKTPVAGNYSMTRRMRCIRVGSHKSPNCPRSIWLARQFCQLSIRRYLTFWNSSGQPINLIAKIHSQMFISKLWRIINSAQSATSQTVHTGWVINIFLHKIWLTNHTNAKTPRGTPRTQASK